MRGSTLVLVACAVGIPIAIMLLVRSWRSVPAPPTLKPHATLIDRESCTPTSPTPCTKRDRNLGFIVQCRPPTLGWGNPHRSTNSTSLSSSPSTWLNSSWRPYPPSSSHFWVAWMAHTAVARSRYREARFACEDISDSLIMTTRGEISAGRDIWVTGRIMASRIRQPANSTIDYQGILHVHPSQSIFPVYVQRPGETRNNPRGAVGAQGSSALTV
jgi:hypothetical protein